MYALAPLVSVTRNVAVAPGLIIAVFLPEILKSCGSLPLFVILNTTAPLGTDRFERTNLNSFAVTRTVVAFVAAGFEIAAGASARPIAATSRANESMRSFM